jgi:hypothetical protein
MATVTGLGRQSELEQAADRIADPVVRLRFLRKHGPTAVPVVDPSLDSDRKSRRNDATQRANEVWRQWAKAGLILAAVASSIGFGLTLRSPVAALPPASTAPLVRTLPIVPSPARPSPDEVWLVETKAGEETYSNGLHVDTAFATHNRPRADYPVFSIAPEEGTPTGFDRVPRGIVYHMTESDLAPFEEQATERIDSLGHMLLRYIRSEHAYHYMIDRFGRVYRVVEESDVANHAGYSVWGDMRGLYVNLNASFLGVAFEGTTKEAEAVTAAQVTSARMLTEMLRARYRIAAENCVTHAQVSVNPQNMRLGNHLDWAQAFPFAALGLPDNYGLSVAAVESFGFTHDVDVRRAAGGSDWAGLGLADQRASAAAKAQGLDLVGYHGSLQQRYQTALELVRSLNPDEVAKGTNKGTTDGE